MTQSNAALAIKYLAVDLVGSFVFFPVWWYTRGAWRTGSYCLRTLRNAARSFGVAVWLKNLFKPMFGQYDAAGRAISFVMRLVMIVWYSLVLLVMAALLFLLFAAWLAFPLFVAYNLMLQLGGVMTGFGP